MTHERIVMARVLRPGEAGDGSFDLDFWARVGPEGRFAAAWEMVGEAERMKGRDGEPPRLDKSAVRVIQR